MLNNELKFSFQIMSNIAKLMIADPIIKTLHADWTYKIWIEVEKTHVYHNFTAWFFFGGGGVKTTREFFTHMELSPLLVKGCKFWPLLGIHGHWAWQWGFISMPHFLWPRTSVYNDHLRGSVTFTPVAER